MTGLACANGTCEVPNLVTLAQGDPLIPQTDPHPDMPGHMRFGCYNSTIVMVANAALANRRGSLGAPGGRTKGFDAIASSVNGAGNHVPKEVNQLIWQYHRQIESDAGVAGTYYLHELVADFANGKILQSHDPRSYGQCWGPATNAAGAAFRDDVWDWAHIDDEYIKALLQDGFVPLLAFGRYQPMPTWNASTHRWDVTLTKAAADQHKVVFSGYTAGAKYGLDIHDPGSGGTANVRLVRGGPGLRSARRSFGTAEATGGALGTLRWRNHDNGGAVQTVAAPSGTFLEYEGSVKPTDPVLVLEHIDAATLDWRGGQRVWNGVWGPWTHLATFTKNGVDHLLTYNRATQKAMISRFWDSLNGVQTVWEGTWGPWTHFVPFAYGGVDHLLTYNQGTRAAMISRFFPGLTGVETIWEGTWDPGLISCRCQHPTARTSWRTTRRAACCRRPSSSRASPACTPRIRRRSPPVPTSHRFARRACRTSPFTATRSTAGPCTGSRPTASTASPTSRPAAKPRARASTCRSASAAAPTRSTTTPRRRTSTSRAGAPCNGTARRSPASRSRSPAPEDAAHRHGRPGRRT
jgi:hypothetical protein